MSKIGSEKYKKYLQERRLVEVLNKKDMSFTFAFRPDSINDQELIDAETCAISKKINILLAKYTVGIISSWQKNKNKERCQDNISLSDFLSLLKKEFEERKIFCILWNNDNQKYQCHIVGDDRYNSGLNFRYETINKLDNEFKAMIFGNQKDIISISQIDHEKSIRFKAAEALTGHHFKSVRRFSWNSVFYRDYQYENGHTPDNMFPWLKVVVKDYIEAVYQEARASAWSAHRKAKQDYCDFNEKHMEDIVSIANYTNDKSLVAEGVRLKNQINDSLIVAQNVPRITVNIDEIEESVQKELKKKILSPINKLKAKNKKISEQDLVEYSQVKKEILENRAEAKRLADAEAARIAEEERKERARLREIARLKREKELKEDIENYMLMLRGSRHGHGHKDSEGNEKTWYETKDEAIAAALKLAKKKDRLLKPYYVMLSTPMEQQVKGWFLTSVADKAVA